MIFHTMIFHTTIFHTMIFHTMIFHTRSVLISGGPCSGQISMFTATKR
jgi:hypothetical protein